ncbi:AAA family ATPase [Emticicia sp. C21]|uniref:AAA family ATPase n=1 Tax=Emticicia sp. C21 TaxID=2302915 RepID=UPI000E344EF2|nr:AAA family ATPase [Emticicia sp. C21]RFS14647.1 ATPase [Emticicia sp. C21]
MAKLKKGLVFGKYMPVHAGHLALIEFAKSQCEQVIVSMSFMPNDPIDHALRLGWLQKIFEGQPNIILVEKIDDFHDESLPLFEATKLWADFIRREFPNIEAFFCSEDYGEPLSFHLGLPCILFDKARTQIPVSASKIRANPFAYWDFIPSVVRPYFVKKVCLFGPESVGKTVLSQKLAKHYYTIFVPEAAREILTSNDIDEVIITKIGERQTELVKEKTALANKLLFCDTDLITTQIYARHYLGFVPEALPILEQELDYDLYFLLDIDVEWVDDPLRDLGDRRVEMYQIFKAELDKRQIKYICIDGNWNDRMSKMIDEINKLLVPVLPI